jgi:hypothetical protein
LVASYGLRFDGTRFWVVHRRREYGPFDYEWSPDFEGVELLYCNEKFGEYCSVDEIYADLKHFRLPMRVVEVTSVVLGSMLYGLLNGLTAEQKASDLIERLEEFGFTRYGERIDR